MSDADFLSTLVPPSVANRPFMVIDDGWQFAHDAVEGATGGPWDKGNGRFPDMSGLAGAIRASGAKPGIWVKPLKSSREDKLPASWYLPDRESFLDPSVPEVLEHLRGIFSGLHSWGYELIKHDFSTFDAFGLWGPAMTPFMTGDGWSFADRSRTSAEIVVNLYRAILEGASGSLVLGCNTIGHLGAGLMHSHRIGDDTSGKHWERTRLMGPNTLAFRLPQHRTFFDIDADCVGITKAIGWKHNKQWLHLLAHSGTTFFASTKPAIMNESETAELVVAMENASRQTAVAEPLDWMDTVTPSRWRIDGQLVEYQWYEETGLFGFGFDIK